jgi:hypothetical protein
MKKITFLIGLVSLLSIGCNSDKRRYELITCPYTINNTTYVGMRMIDTYTGDVWRCIDARKDQDSNWIYAGNPTKLNLKGF